ncbi:ABC transporter permease [Pelagibacterium luteolum]|uniref:Iron(III) transport system permease protein n=1 Tax=Pelagibacterium luteolum TaxID=440168 RepID=A0A1G7XXN8_9HYPH|nr:iron ABC transporter permease [Pelagibacterium luteolum]SDG88918.1 iron(III) transport system permease protein [Pelagibacterium luteolum]
MSRIIAGLNRLGGLWLLLGLAAVLIAPWYKLTPPDTGAGSSILGSALTEISAQRYWLLPPVLAMLAFAGLRVKSGQRWQAHVAVPWIAGAAALLFLMQAFGIGLNGPILGAIGQAFPAAALGQPGLGPGGFVFAVAITGILADALAARGFCRGERFAANAVVFVVALLTLFVLFPILRLGSTALFTPEGVFQPGVFITRLIAPDLWGLGCLYGQPRCGVVINTLILGILSGVLSTLLGLALALLVARTNFRFKGALRAISILPIITPPFVVGVAIIVLFGRTGVVTGWLEFLFDMPRTRWVYGLPGILLAQVLAFAPITFLVLLGTIEAINPTLEEASKTLGAKPLDTFRTVTWPLLRPGIAAAFLLAFIESLADFGNPIVLGGGYDVLSIRIFFAVVGARYDLGNAAVLSIILLSLTLGAFWLQTRWLGRKSYVTITGKSDAGLSAPLPGPLKAAAYAAVMPWVIFTLGVYAIVLIGGIVNDVGRWDLTPTLRHLATAFSFEIGENGLQFYGSAWDSLQTTLLVSAIAAPLTTAIGILTAWLISRQDFAGKGSFEFGTMLSFAIPGTVVGVAYVAAFNVPPVDITGTMTILVICFMFRNMPVGMRAGLAALSQIDRSMEEASQTMGANGFLTLRTVVLPLIRPAIFTSMVYAFVTAMTAVSAVIFLVSARHNMATAYIMGRVENGEYALAIAYSAVLMVIMIACIALIQLFIGKRQLGRRTDLQTLR